MSAAPQGPHAPISNLVQTAAEAAGEEVSPPEIGSAGHSLAPGEDGVEALAQQRVALESAGPQAPDVAGLVDIGRASFADRDVVLETVHGSDQRVRVTDTASYPYRVNASLLITARDGSQWIGTGWFISGRTLITAGHCVYIKNSGLAAREGWVRSIQVMPGRDGDKLPFGSATSTQFWTVRGWADTGDENYDYAAIVLPTPLGDTVGTLGFASPVDATLLASVANVTGYPGDKAHGSELWYDTKQIAAVSPTKVHYDIDTAGGQSGAAVYIIRDGQRLAVAVHAYGGPTTNSGTRISAPVFANLTNWKA